MRQEIVAEDIVSRAFPEDLCGAIVKSLAANLNLGSIRQPNECSHAEFSTSVRDNLHCRSILGQTIKRIAQIHHSK